MYLTILVTANLILYAPTSAALVVLLCSVLTLGVLIQKQWSPAKSYFLAGTMSLVIFGSILSLNYATTGLADATPFRLFWKYADQEKFSKWASPYLMILLAEGSNPELGDLQKTTGKT